MCPGLGLPVSLYGDLGSLGICRFRDVLRKVSSAADTAVPSSGSGVERAGCGWPGAAARPVGWGRNNVTGCTSYRFVLHSGVQEATGALLGAELFLFIAKFLTNTMSNYSMALITYSQLG